MIEEDSMFLIPDWARPFVVDAVCAGALVFGVFSFGMVL